jgi:hypothetical protein
MATEAIPSLPGSQSSLEPAGAASRYFFSEIILPRSNAFAQRSGEDGMIIRIGKGAAFL